MIDVKELRIGNWIRYVSRLVQVSELRHDNVITTTEFVIAGNEYFEAEPITPEILEACGFQTDKLSYWHEYTIDGAVFWITIGHFKDGFRMLPTGSLQIPGRKINGLHDLQNLVHSQTGKELTYSPNTIDNENKR